MKSTTTRKRATPEDEAAAEPVLGPAAIQFGALPSLVGYRIRKAYSRLFQTFNQMLRELNLAPGQYSLLLLIGLNPGLSQMALADATGIDRSTVVPLANRFVKLGWVRRTRRKDDRRVYSLRLTPLGQSILDQAQPIIAAHEEQLVADLTQDERLKLIELLSKVTGDPGPLVASGGGAASAASRKRRTT